MTLDVKRIYVEKKSQFANEAEHLFKDLKKALGIKELEDVRVINRYDIQGIGEEHLQNIVDTILSEPNVDTVCEYVLEKLNDYTVFAVEYLPGQYDQRADQAAQCIQILTKNKPIVKTAKLIALKGNINEADLNKIKAYIINPVDSREASLEVFDSLINNYDEPKTVSTIDGFIDMNLEAIKEFRDTMGFAMSIEDLEFCRDYFKNTEKRNPTITELKVIDTYWSDHCRHTTFQTNIEDVKIEENKFSEPIKKAYKEYLDSRSYVYEDRQKDVCLMDIATLGMKELKKKGYLDKLDVSEEINACSVVVNAVVNGKNEDWLVMFKNETHNHPTEIEPFGGAATCLGGAIRDPLSGRAYVYQAMRVTGAGDPTLPIEKTMSGKLPQRKICTEAAEGYSSYGNQIGLATGQVTEIYNDGYVAKRMEIGAVIGAVKKENVVRETPKCGDVVLLVGGRTGRDGCGGATGSSKAHTEESILNCGAEVQKGNPPVERKIQRLFRNKEVTKLIKRCNDFGAGGVSVAVGELADSLEIYLDKVTKKYEGLDGTELAISESQERMAVVVAKEDADKFIKLSDEENLEATVIAKVTDDRRLKMIWKDNNILNISRDFLDTNGVKQNTKVLVEKPIEDSNYFKRADKTAYNNLREQWLANLRKLNVASQKGLAERFDSTIGANTVLMPFGGKYQLTPAEGMAAKLPVIEGETDTSTFMSYGFNPNISSWSPFHGAIYAVIESVSKIVLMGGRYEEIYLSFQEYFEKLGKDEIKWGKPFSALLGAFYAQKKLKIAAIGGKDSMSGSFKDIHVPPTLVSFAVGIGSCKNIISTEFKKTDSNILLIPIEKDDNEVPNFENLDKTYRTISSLIQKGKILSASTIKFGAAAATISKMSFGNKIGVTINQDLNYDLFSNDDGSFILEIDSQYDIDTLFGDINYIKLGKTNNKSSIEMNEVSIPIDEAIIVWQDKLNSVYPIKEDISGEIKNISYTKGNKITPSIKVAKPRIFIPVFPGTNCEYDTQKAFEKAGGIVDTCVFKNLTANHIQESIEVFVKHISESQIVALPGGFSAGDEPDGSGKFIAAVFRNPKVKEAVMSLLNKRDGLMLGICNGFQALIKLGLLPYGEIKNINENSPTLTFNKIGRHISRMALTKVTSNLSPWFNNVKVGDIHNIALSHGEGRFVAPESTMDRLIENGQIATQYVDFEGNASYDGKINPNGSYYSVEAITSPDGRILGKMGHSERIGKDICKNVSGNKDQGIFKAGVNYFS
ncbi:phosphoribosylformylglycinamidine synthase [Abyssisolibacter fermentans]|uniref:phosphoribosylformylglycinamidine synthase n=1 Tax=Abyssisolibacter fermentans TaxID=1766203 RepID=UPI000831AED7|nr:phosphoribosylformylglycinamidine synthase [Abyssisolibacter fermentans]